MKKSLVFILLVMVLFISGCNGKDGNESNKTTEVTDPDQVLTESEIMYAEIDNQILRPSSRTIIEGHEFKAIILSEPIQMNVDNKERTYLISTISRRLNQYFLLDITDADDYPSSGDVVKLSDLCAFNEVTPQINQVETNPFNQQIQAQNNMNKNNVQIESWAPFGEGRNNMFENPVLIEIAKRHEKSVAQIILRWLIQRDIVTLAKSVNKKRIKENFEIFDFVLSEKDMKKILSLDTNQSLFFNHQSAETVDFFLKLIKERRK